MNEIERIKALSNAFGPSGFEEEVAQIVQEELGKDYTTKDHMLNVRYERDQHDVNKPRVMLDAHLDEVGIIIQSIKQNGTMRFLQLGSWQPVSFPSSDFILRARDNTKHTGIVAVKPPHFAKRDNQNKMPSLDEMIMDVGTCTKSETEQLQIGIGIPGVPRVTCTYDESRKLFFGKGFDCRIGVAAEIQTLLEIQDESLPCEVVGSFSAQEEVGERGVRANAIALKPDIMICFEGCPADDTFQEDDLIQSALYKGPMLRHMDISMITNSRFQKFALDIAHKYNIPVQESVRSGGGTNGAAVNELFGIPAIVIGIPVRYIHSSHCYCTYDDYKNAVKLAKEILHNLDNEVMNSL